MAIHPPSAPTKRPEPVSRPWVIAHRGASSSHPENTIAAFDQALADGADAFELDVQLTRDGEVVVFHDWTLDKAGAPGVRVKAMDRDAIQALDAGRHKSKRFVGERIPSLAEVVERYGSRCRLLVELKADEADREPERLSLLVRKTLDALATDNASDAWILCFEAALLRQVAAVAPSARLVLNRTPPPPRGEELDTLLDGIHALSLDHAAVTPELVNGVHARGKLALVWTVNRERDLDRALAAGVDGIMSDRPRWLRERISSTEG